MTLLGRAGKHAGVVITRVLWWMLRHPVQVAAALVILMVRHLTGWFGVLGLVLLVLAAGLVWRYRWPATFDRQVIVRARSWWRWRWTYRRRWAEVMDGCGLVETTSRGVSLPQITGLRSLADRDTVTLRLPFGQVPGDVASSCEAIAHGLLAWRVSMAGSRPGSVTLLVQWSDPLTVPVSPDLPRPAVAPVAVRTAVPR
jgi:S-DNA-T family DNA segregation ATPase FtsK/SpoIIIE